MDSENDTECDLPGCGNKAASHCKYCGRHVCDFHLRPKHTGSRSYISSLTDPNLIRVYKEDDQSDDGHTCPKYHEQWMLEYEKVKASKLDFNALGALMTGQVTGDPRSCNVFPCDNPPVYTCKICMKRYCAYHANRKRARLSELGGHACVR